MTKALPVPSTPDKLFEQLAQVGWWSVLEHCEKISAGSAGDAALRELAEQAEIPSEKLKCGHDFFPLLDGKEWQNLFSVIGLNTQDWLIRARAWEATVPLGIEPRPIAGAIDALSSRTDEQIRRLLALSTWFYLQAPQRQSNG